MSADSAQPLADGRPTWCTVCKEWFLEPVGEHGAENHDGRWDIDWDREPECIHCGDGRDAYDDGDSAGEWYLAASGPAHKGCSPRA